MGVEANGHTVEPFADDPRRAELFEAVSGYIAAGLPFIVTDGKKPIGGRDWHRKRLTRDLAALQLAKAAEPAIGMKLGPDSFIDIESDSDAEEALVAKLFEGCEPNPTPTFASSRGKHRLFKFPPELKGIRRGVVNFSNGNGAKLGIRIGSDGKGAQSVIPPSAGRRWLVDLEEVEPAELPPAVVERIQEASHTKPQRAAARASTPMPADRPAARCLAAMMKVKPQSGETDSSNRLLAVGRQAKRYGFTGGDGVELVRQYAAKHPFAKDWSDSEILRRIDEADVDEGEALTNATFKCTDLGNGERFASQNGGDVRYVTDWGKWIHFDGTHWPVDNTGETYRRAATTIRTIKDEAASVKDPDVADAIEKWAHQSEHVARMDAMLKVARSLRPIPITVGELDSHPWLFNVLNGTIDLRTGQLHPHRRDDYLTRICPIKYPTVGGGDPVLWLEFLNRIFSGNAALIRFMQRLIGMALVGEVLEHVLPIFHGMGANGKSVLLETVCGVFGPDYAMHAPPNLLMASSGDRHPTELADLHGKRFVAAIETADGGRLSEALVKELTGGDSIRARRMREDFWQFRPSHTVVLATNHRPIVRGTDHGIWRRIRLVPFSVVIPDAEQDKELPIKLRAEWPAILRWAVAGCLAWQRNGLQSPPDVLDATANYRTDSDTLGEFLRDRCYVGDGCFVRAGQLFKTYKPWAEDRGERTDTQTRFGLRVVERGFAKRRDSDNCVVYIGVGLSPAPDSPE
ncbi:MAG: phage/plasmid primase, P4 family [Pirellulales bacterium]